jgi:hypothetical protein
MAPTYRADKPIKGYRAILPTTGVFGMHIGIVKKNDDPQRMGRLMVWIPEFGGDPDNATNWINVSYASPFAGSTPSSALRKDGEDMASSSQSYGWWAVPPDLDNQVLCCFANGNISHGYWIACIYQQNMNQMVPGIASATPTDEQAVRCGVEPPTVEYNRWSDQNPNAPRRPVFEPLDGGLSREGLYPDPQRGPSSTSARREAPSAVYGMLSPRGNTFHIDDNPENEFIRLRTRTGAQVLVNETTGFVYINSRDGNSWIEVSDVAVDIYSLGTVNLRSEGSLNIHADASLNIEADGNLNFRAGGNITMQSAVNLDVSVNGHTAFNSGGAFSAVTNGDLGLVSAGAIGLEAGGNIFQGAGGNHVRNAAIIYDNSGGSGSAVNLTAAVATMNTLPEVTGEAPCYTATTRKTILHRMPTHEPYVEHPSAGDAPPASKASEYPTAEETESVADGPVPVGEPANSISNLSATELDWLTCCMIDEAANQGDDGLAAVAQVVKNRMAMRQSSDGTIKSTVLWPNQFSGFYFDTSPKWHRVCSDRKCAEQRGLQKIERYKKNKSKWDHAYDIGRRVMAGTYSGGAGYQAIRANKRCTMYLNLPVTKANNPKGSWTGWAKDSKKVTTVKDHTFYLA